MTTIRRIKDTDKDAWKGLWEQYNQFYKRTIPAETTEYTFKRFLDTDVKMFCAVADDSESGKTIGFITWYPHLSTSLVKDVVYIHDCFVDPSARNGGVGRKLFDHVYEDAKQNLEAASVYWHTQYFNHTAQILYTKIADRTDFVVYGKVL